MRRIQGSNKHLCASMEQPSMDEVAISVDVDCPQIECNMLFVKATLLILSL